MCRRSGYNTGEDKDIACDLSHAEPVTLPPLPESIPKYFRDIIDAYRREDPSERPAAREILEMFPFSSNTRSFQRELPRSNGADIRIIDEGMRIARMHYSYYKKRNLQLPIFHCNICDLTDFDICLICYDGGRHCYDDSHLLVELGKIGSWIVAQKYHSCVKSSGVRHVIDL